MEPISYISKSSCNTSVASDDNFENNDKNVVAKIKRLKIEENHIAYSLRKPFSNNSCTAHFADNLSQVLDYQKFGGSISDSYRNVKTLFEYVKANTSNSETLKSVDIDDIKMAILELEEKMKTLKKYLQSELLSLQRKEEELSKNINENPARIHKTKKRPNVPCVSYNEIVPSPVKEIINSSFKCLEVQQFQDFIASSGSRYGGWDEYYHNMFIRSWNKYFQVDSNIDMESYIANVMNSEAFQTLLNDLLLKLPAFKTQEIISHSQWYLRYVYLKERQKLAIAQWREKRQFIKKQASNGKEKRNDTQKVAKYHPENAKKQFSSKINCDIIKSSLDQAMSNPEMYSVDCKDKTMDEKTISLLKPKCGRRRLLVNYSTPTKQWINRCQNVYDKLECNFSSPGKVTKLQVPKWRLGLQET